MLKRIVAVAVCGNLAASTQDPRGHVAVRAQQRRVAEKGSANQPWANGYSEEEATELAYIAAAEGCKGDMSRWDCGQCVKTPGMTDVRRQDVNDMGAHSMVGRFRGRCLVAFRGTDSLRALVQDLRSAKLVPLPGCSAGGEVCKVGEGFLQCYESLARSIKKDLESIGCGKTMPLLIVGHSLGGCLTMLALFRLRAAGFNVVKGYTFGQPRVGDSVFARAFEAALAGVQVYRVTNRDDPVPHVYLRGPFQHVGTEVYYWDEAAHQTCTGNEDPMCSVMHESSLLLPAIKCIMSKFICPHRTYFALEQPLPPLLLHCDARPLFLPH